VGAVLWITRGSRVPSRAGHSRTPAEAIRARDGEAVGGDGHRNDVGTMGCREDGLR
jgi:hypothetical protein